MKHTITLLFFFMLAISVTAQNFANRYELVKLGKQVSCRFWNVRPIPAAAKQCTGSPESSRPASRMLPASGR